MSTIALATASGGDSLDEARALSAAAALAMKSGARLVTVHATAGEEPGFVSPLVGELAQRWGSPIEHFPMIHSCCDDVTDTVLDALRRIGPSLVVAGTHGRSGWLQLFQSSVAEGIARNVEVPTLMVPLAGRDLVDGRTGVIDLRRILVPAGDPVAARAGLQAAAWLAKMAGASEVEVVMLHVEDGTPVPDAGTPPPGLSVVRRSVPGPLEAAIVSVAREVDACVLVMATRGHDGLRDATLGSHTERVLREVQCPVLSVPIPRA